MGWIVPVASALLTAAGERRRRGGRRGRRRRARPDAGEVEEAGLAGSMNKKSTESHRHLGRIDERGFAAGIDAIAGPAFVAEVHAVYTLYRRGLGVSAVQETPVEEEALRELVSAFGHYLLRAATTVDRDDPAATQAARAALLRLDRFREGVAGGRTGPAEAEGDRPEADLASPVSDVTQ